MHHKPKFKHEHEYQRAHTCPQRSALCMGLSKHKDICVFASASLHTEGAETMHISSSMCLCPGTPGHMDVSAFIYLFSKSWGVGQVLF